ncbi:hypothetical protein Ahy_A10g048360 isoform B [Arachis hypogaea]|uniref:Transposase MuDR plant domain-containing protein n=1 Tax=Arachis hypogaea TaxID=3818 RepID=A0A445B535_ARAHY|nr:hypothetical protein Ahy_A10g048360 isoform B [Arachis hypogaea]
MNNYGDTQIALTQPAISQPYDRPDHFTRLNLDAMTSDWLFTQGGPEEDPSNEFEVGQQFGSKEEVMLANKQYSIRRAVEYKIVESDHWKYNARCIQFGPGCNWNILISYRQKQERWEVRRYTGPHTCIQTSMGQDHCRLDSKIIAQHIFTMLFWIKEDQHMRVMFDVHARLIPQYVMEWYAAVRDVVVSGGPSSSSPQVVPQDARPIHYAQPCDSAKEYDSEGNSYYVARSASSNKTSSSDEHLDDPLNAGQGEDYNTDGRQEFQVGHRFKNRDVVLMTVNNYSI